MNNEAKVRRSTRSVVLGKAKIMSFEDIEVARAARAAKEANKAKGKGKSAVPEAQKPATAGMPGMDLEPKVARVYEALNVWKAPAAPM